MAGEGSSSAPAPRSPRDGDRFPRAVAKIAVTQICESAGFHSLQRSALETLTDIAIRYLCDVGKASQLYANLSGRTQSNALDVVAALEDMSGASFSDPHGLASSSPCVKELSRFVEYGDELPFPIPLIQFPACKTRKLAATFEQLDEDPPEPHIPSWLPAFPDPKTYALGSSQSQDTRDAHLDTLEQTRQNHEMELSRIGQRLRFCTSGASTLADHPTQNAGHTASMGASPPSASRLDQDLGKADSEGLHSKAKAGKRLSASIQNPFLAPPLPEGSRDVSTWFFDKIRPPSPAPSTKKIIAPPLHSVRDAFRPAIGIAGGNSMQEGFRCVSQGAIPASKDRKPVSMFMSVRKDSSLKRKDARREGSHIDVGNKDERKSHVKQRLSQYFTVTIDHEEADEKY